jgi:hypothetical protein
MLLPLLNPVVLCKDGRQSPTEGGVAGSRINDVMEQAPM